VLDRGRTIAGGDHAALLRRCRICALMRARQQQAARREAAFAAG